MISADSQDVYNEHNQDAEPTPYIPGDLLNLITRLRETRDAARFRAMQSPASLRDQVIWERDPDEWTVAAQIEVLCSRLSEAAEALEGRSKQSKGCE